MTVDPAEYRGNDYYLDNDDGYREWSETIEQQNQQMQELDDYLRPDSLITLEELEQLDRMEREANHMEVIDLSALSWEEVCDRLSLPKLSIRK